MEPAAPEGVGLLCILPSALNDIVMRFKQARVNGGSNYDPLKVAKGLVAGFRDWAECEVLGWMCVVVWGLEFGGQS